MVDLIGLSRRCWSPNISNFLKGKLTKLQIYPNYIYLWKIIVPKKTKPDLWVRLWVQDSLNACITYVKTNLLYIWQFRSAKLILDLQYTYEAGLGFRIASTRILENPVEWINLKVNLKKAWKQQETMMKQKKDIKFSFNSTWEYLDSEQISLKG